LRATPKSVSLRIPDSTPQHSQIDSKDHPPRL
jgi:hypothetical protein